MKGEKVSNEVEKTSVETVSNKDKVVQTAKKAGAGIKNVFGKAVVSAREFSEKDFGKFKGLHIMGLCGVVLVILIICLFMNMGSGSLDYPVVYNTSDGDLLLLTKSGKSNDDAIKLSSSDSVRYVRYSKTSNRYVAFEKNGSLYLYDAKDKDETMKVVSDVSEYYFTENDKYLVAVDDEDNLYSYAFKGEKEKLDSDIEELVEFSDDNVLYKKDDTLYVRSLNAKKDNREKVAEDYSSASLSEDGKKVMYINEDSELISYTIKNAKSEKVADEVSYFYCDKESCDKLYYVDYADKVLYYYNGKESSKIAEEVYDVTVNVEEQQAVYMTYDDGEYSLYYKKGNKDAVAIEEDIEEVSYVRIFDGKGIYYINSDDELRYTKIKGNKVGEVTTIGEDVSDILYTYKNGYVFVGDVDDDYNGTLYLASNGKAKEIDSDVYSSYITVSNDGSKVYYFKDYSSGSGDLYYTSGGKGKEIDTEVHTYNYVKDNLIYYIKDFSSTKQKGDLFRYTGKSLKVDEDVSSLASTPNYFSLDK